MTNAEEEKPGACDVILVSGSVTKAVCQTAATPDFCCSFCIFSKSAKIAAIN